MEITVLVENFTCNEFLKTQHGLSIYIETKKHKILIDTGMNEAFIKNAQILGIDLKEVDTLIITHGHFDHGGGLEDFLKINDKATIYLHKEAFDKYFIKLLKLFKFSVGLEYQDSKQFKFIEDDFVIDEELVLITKPKETLLKPDTPNLWMIKDNKKLLDDFNHEICLIIKEEVNVLFGGCAHNGIVNIIKKALKISEINYCLSGFHLHDLKIDSPNTLIYLENLQKELLKFDIRFFTFHCTGLYPYEKLKEKLGFSLDYLKTGETIKLE